MRNRRSPEIVVIDPRMTETAMDATQHLAIKPKSDQALFYGAPGSCSRRDGSTGSSSKHSTEGVDEFAAFVAPLRPSAGRRRDRPQGGADRAVRRDDPRPRAGLVLVDHGSQPELPGVRTAQAIINLALMTGNIGRPGTGANSITGQCNAMGSRLFSNTTNLLGGHDFANAAHREKVAGILGIDAARIHERRSWSYNEIMEGILRDQIKGLWVVCTNPAHSWINQGFAREMLERLDFLVVQDMYHTTETAQRWRTSSFPPPAGGEGGDLHQLRAAVRRPQEGPPGSGEALADFHIFQLIAHYWGCAGPVHPLDLARGGLRDHEGLLPRAAVRLQRDAGLPLDRRAGGRPVALSRRRLRRSPDPAQERRLFEDGRFYTPSGRAKFLFEEPRPMPEPPTAAYPYIAPDRPRRTALAVAHSDPDRQVGRAAQLYPEQAVRRDQSGRRARRRSVPTSGSRSSRSGDGCGRWRS